MPGVGLVWPAHKIRRFPRHARRQIGPPPHFIRSSERSPAGLPAKGRPLSMRLRGCTRCRPHDRGVPRPETGRSLQALVRAPLCSGKRRFQGAGPSAPSCLEPWPIPNTQFTRFDARPRVCTCRRPGELPTALPLPNRAKGLAGRHRLRPVRTWVLETRSEVMGAPRSAGEVRWPPLVVCPLNQEQSLRVLATSRDARRGGLRAPNGVGWRVPAGHAKKP